MEYLILDLLKSAILPTQLDTLEHFIIANIHPPEIDPILRSLEMGDDYHAERAMRYKSADGWKTFLGRVGKPDKAPFFVLSTCRVWKAAGASFRLTLRRSRKRFPGNGC